MSTPLILGLAEMSRDTKTAFSSLRGGDLGLLPARSHQAEDIAAMLHAFVYREMVGSAVRISSPTTMPGRHLDGITDGDHARGTSHAW